MLERATTPSSISARASLRGRISEPMRIAPAVRLLRGRKEILAAQPMLAQLAGRSGQSGDADSLPYFLSTHDAMKKSPCLLLVSDPAPRAIEGAVLIFEYKTRLGGTRVFATADATGRRTVIAAPECRAQVAATAARALLERGAQVVHIAFSETHTGPEYPATHGKEPATEPPAAGHAQAAIAREWKRDPAKAPRIE